MLQKDNLLCHVWIQIKIVQPPQKIETENSVMTDTRMLDEPDLFISLNNTCNTVNSVNSVNSIKRDGTLRHTCASSTLGSAGSSVQLHDIQCIPSYNGGGYGPDHSSRWAGYSHRSYGSMGGHQKKSQQANSNANSFSVNFTVTQYVEAPS